MFLLDVTFTTKSGKNAVKFGKLQLALQARDENDAYHKARSKLIELAKKKELLEGLDKVWLDTLMKIKQPPPEPIVLHMRYLTRPPDPDLCFDLPNIDPKIAVAWSTTPPDATKSEGHEEDTMIDMAEET